MIERTPTIEKIYSGEKEVTTALEYSYMVDGVLKAKILSAAGCVARSKVQM